MRLSGKNVRNLFCVTDSSWFSLLLGSLGHRVLKGGWYADSWVAKLLTLEHATASSGPPEVAHVEQRFPPIAYLFALVKHFWILTVLLQPFAPLFLLLGGTLVAFQVAHSFLGVHVALHLQTSPSFNKVTRKLTVSFIFFCPMCDTHL